MTFRKDSLLFHQNNIFGIIMTILCLALIPVFEIVLSLLLAIFFILFLLANFKLHNQFITINENGISCERSGKNIWQYEWQDIVELRRSSRFLMPSIDVIVYHSNGAPESFSRTNHYFMLGKTAKKAIKEYYKSTS